MDYGRLLSHSWQITWRSKFLWLWGGLAVLGMGGGGMSGILLRLFFPASWRDPDHWLAEVEAVVAAPDMFLNTISSLLMWGAPLLFVLLLGGWLLFALAEGVIIRAALDAESGQPVAPGGALRGGWALLARFVVIDAAVFFPLFVLLLLMLLLLGGALIGGVVSGLRQQTISAFLLPVGMGGLCLLPLLCLLAPLTLATMVLRGLAFRDTAVYQTGARVSIRHTWAVTRRNLGPLLIVTGLLWGLQTLFDLTVSLVSLPLFVLTLPFAALPNLIITILVIFLAMLVLFLQAILHTFTAVTWTMAYLSVIRNP